MKNARIRGVRFFLFEVTKRKSNDVMKSGMFLSNIVKWNDLPPLMGKRGEIVPASGFKNTITQYKYWLSGFYFVLLLNFIKIQSMVAVERSYIKFLARLSNN